MTVFTDDVYEAIKTYVTAAWDSADGIIIWPNEGGEQPDMAAFILFEITGTLYAQESIGAETQAENRWDEEGSIFFHVFAPVGSGQSQASGRAKAIARLFRGRTLLSGALEFLDASVGNGEKGDDRGMFFRVTVEIQWRHMDAN